MGEANTMDSFEFWLRRMESKLERITNRIKTREEASDLLEMTKDLKEECESRDLPKELLDEDEDLELDEEEEARAMDLLTRYNKVLNILTDNFLKAESLIGVWTKLDEDTKELTAALRTGNSGKISMDELENSLAQIKEMLKKRSNIIDNLVCLCLCLCLCGSMSVSVSVTVSVYTSVSVSVCL